MDGAYIHYDIREGDLPDAKVLVHCSTNDDEDRGYPNTFARWDMTFPSLDAALERTGQSRTGISGISVKVWLNGEQI